MTTAAVAYIKENPWWPVRLLLVYLGNPFFFVAYLLKFGRSEPDKDGKRILGFVTFRTAASTASRINLPLYLAVTLPLYVAWYAFALGLLVPLFAVVSSRALNTEELLSRSAGLGPCLASIPGQFSLLCFSTRGVDGNAFGFLCACPLVLASAAYLVLWIVNVCLSLDNMTEAQGEDPAGGRMLLRVTAAS
jgi:hypothetical protein